MTLEGQAHTDIILVYMEHNVNSHSVSFLLIFQEMVPIARDTMQSTRKMSQNQICDLIRSQIDQ